MLQGWIAESAKRACQECSWHCSKGRVVQAGRPRGGGGLGKNRWPGGRGGGGGAQDRRGEEWRAKTSAPIPFCCRYGGGRPLTVAWSVRWTCSWPMHHNVAGRLLGRCTLPGLRTLHYRKGVRGGLINLGDGFERKTNRHQTQCRSIAELRQCSPQSEMSAWLFTKSDLLEPQTHTGGGGDSVRGFFRRGKFRTFQIFSALEHLLTTPAEEREQNKWERAAKDKAYGGTVAYMDKIPHQDEIRNFPHGKIPPRNSPPPVQDKTTLMIYSSATVLEETMMYMKNKGSGKIPGRVQPPARVWTCIHPLHLPRGSISLPVCVKAKENKKWGGGATKMGGRRSFGTTVGSEHRAGANEYLLDAEPVHCCLPRQQPLQHEHHILPALDHQALTCLVL